jgi:hypothetical protein
MTDPVRRFSGPVRWVTIAVVAAVVLVVLFTLVFPWLERNLSNPTLGAVRTHSLEARSVPPATLGAVRTHSLEARSVPPATLGAATSPGIARLG